MIASNVPKYGDTGDWALNAVRRVIETSDGYARLCAICMMALIVSRYEDQDMQEHAEDLLAAEISLADLDPDQRELVRSFRMGEARSI